MSKRALGLLAWPVALALIFPVMVLVMAAWNDLHPASFRAWWWPWVVAIPIAWLHGRLEKWLRRRWGCEKGGEE